MIKIFISQPMLNKTDEEVLNQRDKAIKKINNLFVFNEEIEIIDSFIEGTPKDHNSIWYLGESIKKLSDADYIYMCKGWTNARGCKIENLVAKFYNIKIIEE